MNQKYDDPKTLVARCKEIQDWHETGHLNGTVLRTYAEQMFDFPITMGEKLSLAEKQTLLEAGRFIVNLSKTT